MRDNDGQILDIVEEKDCDDKQKLIKEVNAGLYLIATDYLKKFVKKIKKNKNSEYYLTDLVNIFVRNGLRVDSVPIKDERKYEIKNNSDLFKKSTELLRHRGPDFEKLIKGENFMQYHSRLSIVDLSDRANQPFQSSDKRYSLLYNGEIMAITIVSLNERKTAIQGDMEKVRETISQLDNKRQELVNNLNALSGALQQCDQFIVELEEEKPKKEKKHENI